jgi:nitroimidazol reductase NimA-like FMN-containing flavoprotein (pyridoxamine 5'-phosphate oxidase superfamily)
MPYRRSMSAQEREAFLAGVHIGVLAVEEPGRGPLALPVWYEWRERGIELGMDRDSRKAELLLRAGRATLTVQDETPPYRYVSVEGRVVLTTSTRDVLGMASRYLGPELGAWYADANPATASSVVFRLAPEHWRTQDFSAAAAIAPQLAGEP